MSKDFSQDPRVMTLLLFEPKLCTLHELQTIYSIKDFYDMLEIIDVQRAFQEEARIRQQQENNN
ncbi:MAG: hypothetical protein GOVbin1096_66 [Prokaryotic dsDNA virus sp.]|nr:MAG: hypothetical protein GOVbin1096_66 [Prokaryotic dsDNA virus sp.]